MYTIFKEEIKSEIRKYIETNEYENTAYQNLWEIAIFLQKQYKEERL